MSEPADAPRPEPEKYEWREPRDMNCDILALVVTGVIADYDAATSTIETLDHEQLVTALWCVLRWYGTSLALNDEDPVGMLQGLALVLAKGRGEVA